MNPVKVTKLAEVLGTVCHNPGTITSLCTDSREAVPGSLFVAIPGERVDGHSYVGKALELGATAALVQRPGDYPADRTLLVEDTVKALLRFAAWYRTTLTPQLIAVTGSVGKTTTKEMIAAVVSAGFRTVKTIGNQNNEIGAPRTLLSMDSSTQAAVLELGMSGFGEIRALAQAARPQIGVITNIGVSHLEHLGSRENILKAKLELADCLPDGAPLFLCADNDLLEQVSIPRLSVLYYGIDSPKATLRGTITGGDAQHTDFIIAWQGGQYPAAIPGTGRHLVLNALAAFGVGVTLGMTPQAAVAALGDYQPSGMRQHVVNTSSGITVVEDCYNASPDSVAAALRTLGEFPCKGKRYAVLSDMLELGDATEQGHVSSGKLAAASGVDGLFVWGDHAALYAQGALAGGMTDVNILPNKQQLVTQLVQRLRPGDVVWFKASHSMKLEEAVEQLYEKINP
ncbi:MAG: UDP-N-acetylmuramoyl-tripeptide--D-alanyl-D-alanine ligase [Angelakisella sp.]